ncbi:MULTISPECIES: holo-ACP synthase [unclassified Paenibacillus]|uniref:holo-ACP synthase n=1 Tax=unclassified Paenibacillus TaxID=185978 RepID=UPI001AE60882|nr:MULTISPECIES: holo-ACP synthase [unclassified Paenibacillus]MBP1157551.1 holo-[acyl-carrier protein] synthase [Paenibacillus sp. PvP091]MBP1171712.1 holo-[acyl-carrier protein] synthase [Paenibacillus sp. PvR098]MBP2438093.1 holo-[acyl-carrier protein] synthase [Paenibacillus sp. PvP052]
MIIGIGTDLLDIARVRKILEQSAGSRFLERVLTSRERELAASRQGRLAEFTAGRFAAKEAVVKAIGCGIGKEISFQDLEILPDRKGKPLCSLSEAAMKRLSTEGILPAVESGSIAIHLSITHTETMAMAYAIVERRDGAVG